MEFRWLRSYRSIDFSQATIIFIDEKRHEGESLRQAVVEASLARLLPVLFTVLATIGGLFSL